MAHVSDESRQHAGLDRFLTDDAIRGRANFRAIEIQSREIDGGLRLLHQRVGSRGTRLRQRDLLRARSGGRGLRLRLRNPATPTQPSPVRGTLVTGIAKIGGRADYRGEMRRRDVEARMRQLSAESIRLQVFTNDSFQFLQLDWSQRALCPLVRKLIVTCLGLFVGI